MMIHSSLEKWNETRQQLQNQAIGFVPTMGALHAGHTSLLQRARQENEIVILSIFVNPTQFDDKTDLVSYPISLEEDLELARKAGCDHVILPDPNQIYPDLYTFRVSETSLSKKLCGAHRPGHFDGVLTVVLKLLNMTQPTRAYFGEKDFQQLELIREMVRAFFIPVEVISCPTVRENDGLALSSRNRRLSTEARLLAPSFYLSLVNAPNAESAREHLVGLGFDVDYVEDHVFGSCRRRLGAVKLGGVRLIDNVEIGL